MRKKYIPKMNGSVIWINTDPTTSLFPSIREEKFLEDVIQISLDIDPEEGLELIVDEWDDGNFSHPFLNYCFLRLAQLQETMIQVRA